MSAVLCLDLSRERGEALLTVVGEHSIEIIESRALSLGKTALLSIVDPASSNDPGQGELENPLSTGLRKDLEGLSGRWNSALVVLPEENFLGLNIELPFSDAKNIGRVLDLEIQDIVPFDIQEFAVQHRLLGPSNNSNSSRFDIFVGLIPKSLIKNTLAIVQGAGVEPNLITTPASAASAVLKLAPSYFRSNSMIVVCQDPYYSAVLSINGESRSERVFKREISADTPSSFGALITELRLTTAAFEKRYETTLETIYLLGAASQLGGLEQSLGRPVERLTLDDMTRNNKQEENPAPLAALFAQDDPAHLALCNFRSGEFAFSPHLQEILNGLIALRFHAFAAIASTIFAIGLVYFAREQYISSQSSALLSQVQRVITGFESPTGNVIADLRDQETKLSDALGTLGSPSSVTPLDILGHISKDIPDMAGLQITTIKINGNRATLEGVAPDLSAVDKIEKALKQNKKRYSKVTAQTGAASAATKGYRFSLEVILQQ